MRKLWLPLFVLPVAAHAGFQLDYDLKGLIVGYTERDGKCYVAIDSQEHPQYSRAYHHLEDPAACNVARMAYRLNERVVAKAYFYSAGNRGSATHGIKAVELSHDDKPYWPPYGKRK